MKLPVAVESFKYVAACLVLGALLGWVHYCFWVLGILLSAAILLFFRDPDRVDKHPENVIVAPADGRVVQVKEVVEEGQSWKLVSIFMSPLDVHINYAPVSGKVSGIEYRIGQFLCADRAEASIQNETNILTLETNRTRLKLKQIAGFFARRIVSYSRIGEHVKRGQKIGLIQFGSRVDLFLPPSTEILVQAGQRVRGVLTVLGVEK